MAEIKQYSNPIEGLQTTDRASDALIRSGREISANYGVAASYKNRLGEVADSTIQQAGRVATDYMKASEINKGAPAFMGLYANRTKTWEDALKANPNDPTLQQKYLEDTENQLQKFKENFLTEGGQKWAESRIDAFRQHLITKTTSDISNVAAAQTKGQIDQMVNAASAMAANSSNVEDVKFLLGSTQESINALVDSNPRISATQAASIKELLAQQYSEKIVRSAVLTLTMKNPAAGEKMSKDPAFAKYIDGIEIKQQASLARRVNKDEERAAKTEQREQQIMANDQAIAGIVGATLPEQEGGSMRVPPGLWTELRKASTQPGMRPERIESTVRYLKAVETGLEKVRTDPDTMDLFDKKAADGTLTVDDIKLGAAERRLSPLDTRRYSALINMKDPTRTAANKYYNDGVNGFKSSITKSDPLSGIADPAGDQRWAQFKLEAREGFETVFKRDGLPAAQKWLKEDMRQLAVPYVGKKGMQSTIDRAQSLIREGTKVEPNVLNDVQQRPGETTEQYLKRRAGK